jgi:gliding motility-associated-like protein
MTKTTLLNCILFLVSFFIVSYNGKIEAQIVISAPELQFSQACANETFNSFAIDFVFSPETGIDPANQFLVEMSDPSGSFTNSEIIFTSSQGAINASPATIDFSLPSTIAGEAYKIRLLSTRPAAISAPSDSFAAYYKIQDSPFTINNLIGAASFCPGGSFLLTIDNPGAAGNDSPLNYPSLTFNWFKEINPTNSVLVAQGPNLTVTQEGIYFAETNYGSCTSDSFSNRVTVTEAISGDEVIAAIISSLGNPFCASDGPTTLSTIAGNSYKWYKDGTILPEATSRSYQTSTSGLYSVRVDFGSCEASGSIDLRTGDFLSSLNVPINNLLEAGDTLSVTVTTDAISPNFVWLLNNEVIPNATQNTYEVTDFGTYSIIIEQTSGCITTNELVFQVEEYINLFPEVAFIPNLISPNGDGINDTWVIPLLYVSGTNTKVVILNSQGKKVLSTNDYSNNWPEDQLGLNRQNQVYYYLIKPIDQEPKMGSLTIIK